MDNSPKAMDTSHTDTSNSNLATKGKPNSNLATKGKPNSNLTTKGKPNSNLATKGKPDLNLATKDTLNSDISKKDKSNSDSFPNGKEMTNSDISQKDNSNSSKKSVSEKRGVAIPDDLIDDSIQHFRTPRDNEGMSLLFTGFFLLLLNKSNITIN